MHNRRSRLLFHFLSRARESLIFPSLCVEAHTFFSRSLSLSLYFTLQQQQQQRQLRLFVNRATSDNEIFTFSETEVPVLYIFFSFLSTIVTHRKPDNILLYYYYPQFSRYSHVVLSSAQKVYNFTSLSLFLSLASQNKAKVGLHSTRIKFIKRKRKCRLKQSKSVW